VKFRRRLSTEVLLRALRRRHDKKQAQSARLSMGGEWGDSNGDATGVIPPTSRWWSAASRLRWGARPCSAWSPTPGHRSFLQRERSRARTVASVARAAPTLFALTRPTLEGGRDDPEAVFRAGFALTYRAELRAERRDRSGSIVDAEPERYRLLGAAVLAAGVPGEAEPVAEARAWRRRRRKGKALTLVRLMKASTTFAGGIDYLAWKINRHAGTNIQVRPWQRRWPLIAALILLPRLLKRGAIR
jgi:hypothetical protein